MKKLIVLFSAVAALAACSKNEVVPSVSGENVEISYKVAPRTKAETQAFGTENVFASWAYYLPKGQSWETHSKDAQIYFGEENAHGVEISYDKDKNVWKNKTTSYYWPKEGKLTFFAYSLNSNYLKDKFGEDTFFYCTKNESQYGICGSLHLDEDPNTDLLVADMAADKNANETAYKFNGVPTLFKHKLSRVKFAVKKKSDYPGATITLNSITFKNLVNYMFYNQYKINNDKSITHDYITYDILGNIPRSEQKYTETPIEVSSTTCAPVPDANVIRYIYIPQDFKNVTDADNIATIEVKYTVTFKKGNSETDKGISETYTKTLNVKDIFDSWEIGKRYTFNLIFSLDEIKWAPAVGDWEDEIKNIDVVTGEVKPADGSTSVDGNTTTDEQC